MLGSGKEQRPMSVPGTDLVVRNSHANSNLAWPDLEWARKVPFRCLTPDWTDARSVVPPLRGTKSPPDPCHETLEAQFWCANWTAKLQKWPEIDLKSLVANTMLRSDPKGYTKGYSRSISAA